jgi:di/tricarboxylate transporter
VTTQLLSIAVLFLIFVVGAWRPINLGVLALVATFGVGALVSHDALETMLAGFPANVFVLLLGVTYLFGLATVNGTIDWIVVSAARLFRENRAAMPWVLFLLAAIPTNAGAAGPAGIALLAPIAMRMADRYGISARLAGLMVINGADSGNLSPLNILGVIINGTLHSQGLDVNETTLWIGNFVFNVGLGVVAYLICGGLRLRGQAAGPSASHEPAAGGGGSTRVASPAGSGGGVAVATVLDAPPVARPMTLVLTLTAIGAVATGALVFDLDIGALAICAAVLLTLLMPVESKGAFERISWSTIALICGVVTYVTFMQYLGTIDMIGDKVAGIAAPLLAAFLLCLMAAVTSAFASSIAILGVLIPLSVPFLSNGDISVVGLVLAIGISATVVDATPFSSVGALTVAAADERQREGFSRDLIKWGFSMVVVAPIVTWALFVVPFS